MKPRTEQLQEKIQEAVAILEQGGIVIYPTDTAFGIGCRLDDEKAVEKLFSIRKRPNTQAVPVLFNSTQMIQNSILTAPCLSTFQGSVELSKTVDSLPREVVPGMR